MYEMAKKKQYLVFKKGCSTILGFYDTTEAGIRTITNNLTKKHGNIIVLSGPTLMNVNINSYTMQDATCELRKVWSAYGNAAEVLINFQEVSFK